MINNMHVACPLMPRHHPILLMYGVQSIKVQTIQIMDSVCMIWPQQQSIRSRCWCLLMISLYRNASLITKINKNHKMLLDISLT